MFGLNICCKFLICKTYRENNKCIVIDTHSLEADWQDDKVHSLEAYFGSEKIICSDMKGITEQIMYYFIAIKAYISTCLGDMSDIFYHYMNHNSSIIHVR